MADGLWEVSMGMDGGEVKKRLPRKLKKRLKKFRAHRDAFFDVSTRLMLAQPPRQWFTISDSRVGA